MHHLFIGISLILVSLFSHAEIQEGSVDIEISGNILARTCDIATADATKNVDLHEHDRRAFSQVGDTSPTESFTIQLENCVVKPNDTNSVYMTFSGQPASDAELLALSHAGNDGVAGGIAVEILNSGNQRIPLNSEQTYPISAGDNLYTFGLRYSAIAVPVTAGDANAVLYIDLRYE